MSYTELFYADLDAGVYRIAGATVTYGDIFVSSAYPGQPDLSSACLTLFEDNVGVGNNWTLVIEMPLPASLSGLTTYWALPLNRGIVFEVYPALYIYTSLGGYWFDNETSPTSYQIAWAMDASNNNTVYDNGTLTQSGIGMTNPMNGISPLGYNITEVRFEPTPINFIALYGGAFSTPDLATYSMPGSRPSPSPPPTSYTPNWQLPTTIPTPLGTVPCCQMPGGLCHC